MSTGCQKDRQRDRQTARQTDRQKDRRKKTERFFSLLIKTKDVQNVNWMSERQKWEIQQGTLTPTTR